MCKTFRFLAVTAFLFNFAAPTQAADDTELELEAFGTDYDSYEEINVYSILKEDRKRIDAVLKPVLDLIDLGRGGAGRVQQAGLLLDQLITIHSSHQLGTHVRQMKLNKLKTDAKALLAGYKQAGKDLLIYAPQALEGQIHELRVADTVKTFLVDYLIKHTKRFSRVSQNFSAALLVGVNAGVGFGQATYLSGKKYITFCPSIGATCGFGIATSIESCDGEGAGCYTDLKRLHNVMLFVGPVTDMPENSPYFRWSSIAANPPLGTDASQDFRGVAGGLGSIEVYSRVFEKHLCRVPGRYLGFARERLGLTYEDEPCQG